jgi:hypothetical protein
MLLIEINIYVIKKYYRYAYTMTITSYIHPHVYEVICYTFNKVQPAEERCRLSDKIRQAPTGKIPPSLMNAIWPGKFA